MQKIYFILTALLLSINGIAQQRKNFDISALQTLNSGVDYQENTVLIKVYDHKNIEKVDKILKNRFSAISTSIVQKFPYTTIPNCDVNQMGQEMVDLTKIYQLEYTGSYAIKDILIQLKMTVISATWFGSIKCI